jgi:hypothetical protein
MENENDGKIDIKLDGSYGVGPTAELAIVTKDPITGEDRTETFVVPYLLIDAARLQRFNDFNLILGYSLIKREKPNSALKELGL